MLNSCVFIGRIATDIELRFSGAGEAVAKFRIAVDRGTKNAHGEKEVDFLNVVTFKKQAQTLADYKKKGDLIAITGRVQINQWTTDEGQKREKAEVVANTVRFLDRGTDAPAGGKSSMGSEPNFNDDDDVPF